MSNSVLKQRLGDAGAGLDSSFDGQNRLYDNLKSLSELGYSLDVYQTTIATATIASKVVNTACKLTNFRTSVAVCGTADSTVVEVQVNGVEITAATTTIANDDADGVKSSVDLNVTLAAGDLVEIVVSAAPTAGSGLTASLEFKTVTVE